MNISIQGSKEWIKSIQQVGLVSREEMESVISGLNKVYAEWENNSFVIKENDEDIHTANEVWMNFNIRKAFEIIVYLLIIRDACVK